MNEKLYVVYGECDCVYVVKANNKKEAIDLTYSEFGRGYGEIKKHYVAKNLEKELFRENGFERRVVMLL